MYRKNLIRLGTIRRATFPKGKAFWIRNLVRKSLGFIGFEPYPYILMPRSAFDLGSDWRGSAIRVRRLCAKSKFEIILKYTNL